MRLKIVDNEGNQLPNDGVSEGTLHVRGPTVVERYMSHEKAVTDSNGWFDTGDVGTIDEDGYLTLTDRSKDLIKSGGEWISSILLEEIIRQHPLVHDAGNRSRPQEVDGAPHHHSSSRGGRAPDGGRYSVLLQGQGSEVADSGRGSNSGRASSWFNR